MLQLTPLVTGLYIGWVKRDAGGQSMSRSL